MEQTVDEILKNSIQEHGGIFLGEAHGQPQTVSYLKSLAPTLKAAGVETLYVEFINHEDQAFLDALTPDDPDLIPKLKELVRRRSIVARGSMHVVQEYADSMEEYANSATTLEVTQEKISGDAESLAPTCDMYACIFSAYIKAGIRLVGMEDPGRMALLNAKRAVALEKKEITREEFYDLSLGANTVSRNESWVRVIRKDQEQSPSKFAVLGGLGHSAQGHLLTAQENSRANANGSIPPDNEAMFMESSMKLLTNMEGMLSSSVDFQLGIPTVLFYDTTNAAHKNARLLGVDTNHYGKCIKIVTPDEEPQHVEEKLFIYGYIVRDIVEEIFYTQTEFVATSGKAIIEALGDWIVRTLPDRLTDLEFAAIKDIIQNTLHKEEHLALFEKEFTDPERNLLLENLVKEMHADFSSHPVGEILIDRKQEEDRQRLKQRTENNARATRDYMR